VVLYDAKAGGGGAGIYADDSHMSSVAGLRWRPGAGVCERNVNTLARAGPP
jgi:hypothetical protein